MKTIGELSAAIQALAVLAVLAVVYVAYTRWLAPAAQLVPSAEAVKQGAADIAAGLPGYLKEKLTGADASGYITWDQAKANAAANLATHNALLGGA